MINLKITHRIQALEHLSKNNTENLRWNVIQADESVSLGLTVQRIREASQSGPMETALPWGVQSEAKGLKKWIHVKRGLPPRSSDDI